MLTAVSVGGVALLAPLAARSAAPVAVDVDDRLVSIAEAQGPLADRGPLSGRQGLLTANRDGPQAVEQITTDSLPTPGAASMEATLHIVATPSPTVAPASAASAASPQRVVTYDGDTVWDDLAQCESGGNWAINTGNGYYGGLQFNLGTWQGYGGADFAAYPHEATRDEQITVAERLRDVRGYQPWPACRAKLGLP